MVYAILAVLVVVCSFGWLVQYVHTAAIIRWIVRNEIPFSADQITDDLDYVWRKVLRIK